MQTCLRSLAAVAAAVFLLCNCAHAAGTAFAGISNVQLTVADLTPDDGVAAGYDIGPLYTELAAFTLSESQSSYPDPYQADHVRVGHGGSYSQASVGSTLGDLAAESAADADLGMFGTIQGFSLQTIWLTLRPHTALTIGGQAATMAQRVPGNDVDYFAESYLGILAADQDWHQLSWLEYESRVLPEEDLYHAQVHDFQFGYANDSDESMTVILQLSASNYIRVLPAVPEPAAWAMLAAGLAVLGVARSRRQRGGMGSRAA